jgi:hypothetical protein
VLAVGFGVAFVGGRVVVVLVAVVLAEALEAVLAGEPSREVVAADWPPS